jgi:sulfur-carrier protein
MKFNFSGSMLRFTDYRKQISIEAKTLTEAFENLVKEYPNIKAVIFDREGLVRTTHQLFLNGEQINRDGLNVEIGANDCLDIITAIAGG